jgi:phosphoserine phosphatase
MTGAVLLRGGRGSGDLNVAPLAEMLPSLVLQLREKVEAFEGADPLEFLEVSTERVTMLVALVSETQEGLALVADRGQPLALLTAALTRAVRAYAERLAPTRH